MNKIIKRVIALSAACVIAMSSMANVFAADFIDMPDNWTTEALNNAVANGLLYGEEAADGSGMKINPDDNITRAQMAAIIVRAFGATEKTDISAYTDVDKEAWYYEELSKAVAMNAFRGDGDLMTPQNNITFQECFTVLSQILQLQIHANDETCLEKFDDDEDIAEWAIPYATAIVGSGYWDGIENKLLPKEYITRSQFAVLINNIASTYIDEPGTYSDLAGKNVMVRSNDVIISATDVGSVIIGDGVTGGFKLDNTKLNVTLFARGGGTDIQAVNKSYVNRAIIIEPELAMQMDETSTFPIVKDTIYMCHDSNNFTFSASFTDDKTGTEDKTEATDEQESEELSGDETEATDENAEDVTEEAEDKAAEDTTEEETK